MIDEQVEKAKGFAKSIINSRMAHEQEEWTLETLLSHIDQLEKENKGQDKKLKDLYIDNSNYYHKEQSLINKLKEDIEDGNFTRHGQKQGAKDGSTYYKIGVKEYAQEILSILEGEEKWKKIK